MQISLRLSIAAIFAAASFLFLPQLSQAATITIVMNNDNTFTPRDVTINPGDTVTWVNNGSMAHTATASNGSFDSGTIQPGQSFSATFQATGSYTIYCKFHGSPGGTGMAGSVNVSTPYIPPVPSAIPPPISGPVPSPQTPSSLAAQAQALLAQIAALQAQLNGGQTGTVPVAGGGTVTYDASSCPQIGGSLKRGSRGDDVSRLQMFLARDSSVYPEAQVSGYYGALTEAAVKRWQAKYHVVSSGTPASTGYGVVGPRTAAAIAILCTTGTYNGVPGPGPNDAPVGGFITVTPISGAAPITINVAATVNTTKSCLAQTYDLDFGDSSEIQHIPVAAGDCKQFSQTYPHTYQYGGTYTIKLSAGTHATTATVQLTGPAAPPPPIFTAGLPKESFVAYPTSGPAPLTVTFAGVVNSNDAGFCTGGCVDTMDYGDGVVDTVALPASIGGWLNYKLTHTYAQTGGFRATLYQGGAGVGQPTVGAVTIIVGEASPGPVGPSGGYQYQPPTVTAAGSDSLAFSASFDLPSGCTGYNLSWGDGSPEVSQNDGGNSCAQSPVVRSFQHTYGGAGAFTITLKRGAQLQRVDDISLTITN